MESIIVEKEKTDSASNCSNWVSSLIHLRRFQLKFEDIDAELLSAITN